MGLFDGAIGGAIGAVGSLIGGGISANTSNNLAGLNYNAQKEFAQNGIRWRVEDAKKAGIHPLYALGASTASFSPVSGYGGDYGISDAARTFGQGIDRAAEAKMTREERERLDARMEMQDVFALARFRQEQRYQDAQVRLIDSEIARNKIVSMVALKSASQVPAMPGSPTLLPGQGDAPPVSGNVPSGDPMYQFMETSVPGVYTLQPGNDFSQVYDDKGFILEQWPLVKTNIVDYSSRATGRIVNGMVYSDIAGGWVRVNSKLGKEALDSFSSRTRRFVGDWVSRMKDAIRFYSNW